MLRALFLFHTCRHQYPGTAAVGTLCPQPTAVSDFPASTGRSSCTSPFSRLAQCSLTLRPACSPSHLVTLYTEGFSHFVTSMTAPITSGWSKSRRVGFAPTGKAPPFHGARRTRACCTTTDPVLLRRVCHGLISPHRSFWVVSSFLSCARHAKANTDFLSLIGLSSFTKPALRITALQCQGSCLSEYILMRYSFYF